MPDNNSWIEANESSTVVVFVHGILSSSEACWRNPKNGAYWPELVLGDPEFVRPSVFVAGYTADVAAGEFEIYDAAEEMIVRLRARYAGRSPMDKTRILFVCHSQGGIVVRQMLTSFSKEFEEKRVGVVLCGSPGWGSFFGSVLRPFASLIGFRQAVALSWGSTSLVNLDREFLRLIKQKTIRELYGMSLVETRGFWGLPKIVSAASASRYFPEWKKIPKVKHGEVVKPDSINHLSHVYLRDFAKSSGFLEAHLQIEPDVLALLELEKQRCRALGGQFRTPNLMAVLLRIDQGLAQRSLWPEQRESVTRLIEDYEARMRARSAPPFVEFSWLDLQAVAHARDLAVRENASDITEAYLWRGAIEAPSGTLQRLQSAIGASALEDLCRRARTPNPSRATLTPGQ